MELVVRLAVIMWTLSIRLCFDDMRLYAEEQYEFTASLGRQTSEEQ